MNLTKEMRDIFIKTLDAAWEKNGEDDYIDKDIAVTIESLNDLEDIIFNKFRELENFLIKDDEVVYKKVQSIKNQFLYLMDVSYDKAACGNINPRVEIALDRLSAIEETLFKDLQTLEEFCKNG